MSILPHSLTNSLTHSLTNLHVLIYGFVFTDSLTHLLTHSLTHSHSVMFHPSVCSCTSKALPTPSSLYSLVKQWRCGVRVISCCISHYHRSPLTHSITHSLDHHIIYATSRHHYVSLTQMTSTLTLLPLVRE